jgi:hypothetical protein
METKLGYIVILPWMREDLDLKGNELLVYALIHGFSQEAQGCFFGSLEYISRACGCARNTTIGTLKNLVEKGLLRKREFTENNVKVCQYTAITGGSAEIALPVQKMDGGSAKIGLGGSAEIAPNNKTIIENKSITKCKATRAPLILPFPSDKFRETWEALCEEKNWKGKTQKALQLTLNKLGRYHEDFAVELMEKTIENGWKGVVFSDTDAKFQEWQSARQQKIDNAVQRTTQPMKLDAKTQEMQERLKRMREQARRAQEAESYGDTD